MALYVDIRDGLLPSRLYGIDQSRLLISKPTNYVDLLRICSGLSPEIGIVVIDGFEIIEEIRKDKKDSMVANLLVQCPKTSVVGVQTKGKISKAWGIVAKLKKDSQVSFGTPGEVYGGHIASLSGPWGKEKVFIGYNPGRVSVGYEIARILRENKCGKFTYGNVSERGFWEFVRKYDESEGAKASFF